MAYRKTQGYRRFSDIGREAPSQRMNMSLYPLLDAQRQPQSDENHHFTVLIRLPFPRGDFVDPPAVCNTTSCLGYF